MAHPEFANLRRALLLAACMLFSAVPVRGETIYTFSVVPQFERRVLFGIWQPIVDELEKRTGARFQLTTSLSVSDYERDVHRGVYDFIYVNPYVMPNIEEQPGYVPLIRDRKPLRGILVVRKDSPIRKVEELQGKTLAVPSMSALGASLLLRAELDRQYKVKTQVVLAKTHSSVFLHVVNGFADAGGSVQKAFSEQDQRVRDALRVLYQTSEVPSHPLAAHQRVPAALREQVRKAFIDLSATPQGRELLGKIPMQEAVAASSEDYRPLRALKLESYLQP
ncbi:phosphate/phosphite/phosphonate ABC transporter substrate-binding protein [Azonexus sp.]|uniref:phosphate/phosphite/phosphonate ABC transporter substrate-binding protein n=1 Tax=Azonexus sp. TaxID=1872668 RepID=UPI0035B34D96